jgi:hypothetical protein
VSGAVPALDRIAAALERLVELEEAKARPKPARRPAKPAEPRPEDHAHVARLLRRKGLAR